jgi:hypothetical protein
MSYVWVVESIVTWIMNILYRVGGTCRVYRLHHSIVYNPLLPTLLVGFTIISLHSILTPSCLVSGRSVDVLSSWRLAALPLILPYWLFLSLSLSYVTTDGQSASLSWNKAPIWGLRPDFYYCQTIVGLLMWGAPSDERTGLSFTIAAGPSQRSHSRVRAPWVSRPYFTLSDFRLPISSPPTTRRITVEVFDPASTRVTPLLCLFSVCYLLPSSTSPPTVAFPIAPVFQQFGCLWISNS